MPIDAENVRMYVCGPTVYDRAHLGNARPVVVFDALFRLLRQIYGADHVTYVRNFTDVDDKINAAAAERGISIAEISNQTIDWYHEDMDALGALRPSIEPRATDNIDAMQDMIATLISRGHAYDDGAGSVLFSVRSYPSYGQLSGRALDDMIAGARVEVAKNKRDPLDFVLWKPSDEAQPGWDSPWGYGRPGWHIECSAMSHRFLGASFDIHGGGLDLQFPHHENEIAQSCAAIPNGDFARFWIHNELLQVDGRKMSKSLGNFFTVRDLLEQGFPGEVIRMVLLGTHYAKPMDWTRAKADEARATLTKWRAAIDGVAAGIVDAGFLAALQDDLNTPGAITELHRLYRDGNFADLRASAGLLGLLEDGLGEWAKGTVNEATQSRIAALITARNDAKAARDFARADAIRDALIAAGVVLRDGKDGTMVEFGLGFDQSKIIEALGAHLDL